MSKTVSLILGSGGARGMAHIGVIKWLEENDYVIKSISGSSMGAMVGGFYAAGKLDNYTDFLMDLDTLDMLKLLDFQGTGGLVSGKRLFKKLKELVGNPNIEDLPIKYTAVASDIKGEKEIWINSGKLLDAIRASASLPLFFTPYEINGTLLIDGGVLNPVPIAPTFDDNTDLKIAVNLGGKAIENIEIEDEPKNETTMDKINTYINSFKTTNILNTEMGIYKVADKSFDAMQGTIARMKLASYPPDIEIEIPRNLCGTLEFDLAKKIIDYGYHRCEEVFNPNCLIGN